ncbi:hypothetical protein Z948_3155 [Sulfitobacter donghicola DSW-25 = KCTC 12864 = JCM 14565]|uniref:Uncharacterized protein n=1 Tax=Sulfitobacter donghicola DSW-25 = KCTC 12864 = JCM 14565 TaxID=1300350 RepID=A0A073IWB5_9RHOB|nr:hypothetical protein DSW25_11340 [Sulfitobacter donghicola DSW-25 = KCTC 12864 = JCM 14565]KIN69414.1 hypothetical protein Z948_3155 [Sulfitobacter donghicola DSW-25 = KCTC 12864 = JCM 14565]
MRESLGMVLRTLARRVAVVQRSAGIAQGGADWVSLWYDAGQTSLCAFGRTSDRNFIVSDDVGGEP